MESLLHSTGAVAGNCTRILELATRDSAVEPPPPRTRRAARGSRTLHRLVTGEVPRSLGLGGKCSDERRRDVPICSAAELRSPEWNRQESNLRPFGHVVPAAFAAEPPSGVAPDTRPLQGGAPTLGDGKGERREVTGLPPLRSRELHALDCSDKVTRAELALREERDDLEHGVGEATDVQHVVTLGDLRRSRSAEGR